MLLRVSHTASFNLALPTRKAQLHIPLPITSSPAIMAASNTVFDTYELLENIVLTSKFVKFSV